jgi:predicted ATP-grasp superfamily ATP-dependent carboligase
LFNHDAPDLDESCFPLVIKPRFGAGSQSTYLFRNSQEFSQQRETLASDPALKHAIWQRYFAGCTLSAGLLIDPETGRCEVLPICEQFLSDDGRFHYHGGRVPVQVEDERRIQESLRRACQCVPGLRGYVGIDFLLRDNSSQPVLVEINPRLTTSYLGYSTLCRDNLAERLLAPGRNTAPLRWHAQTVRYQPSGEVSRTPAHS